MKQPPSPTPERDLRDRLQALKAEAPPPPPEARRAAKIAAQDVAKALAKRAERRAAWLMGALVLGFLALGLVAWRIVSTNQVLAEQLASWRTAAIAVAGYLSLCTIIAVAAHQIIAGRNRK